MNRRERIIDGLESGSNGLPVFEDEQAFQEYLEAKFEDHGFTAIQEVRPHKSRYKADLLLIHDHYGKIGLELKWMTGGTDAAKAHKQIADQYAGRKYLGDRVNKWAFAPYMPKLQGEQNHDNRRSFQRGKLEVIEHFFHRYGIGTLNVHESPYCMIKFGSQRRLKIPGFCIHQDDVDGQPNLYDIEQRVKERLFNESD